MTVFLVIVLIVTSSGVPVNPQHSYYQLSMGGLRSMVEELGGEDGWSIMQNDGELLKGE